MLTVTNNGAAGYRFDQYGTTDDPTIFAINATTIAFNLQATGHPFLIQDNTGTNYNTGLVHVSTAGVVSTGANAQGKDSGTLYWKIPDSISGSYRYQCGSHAAMVGTITVKNFGSI
jgi:plastocyanin